MSTNKPATLIDARLEKFIATRDRRQRNPVTDTPLREAFDELISKKRLEVGGRSTCGTKVDSTWLFFTAWGEIVRKATTMGLDISVTPVKHKNKSPTTCGGYWHSNVYELRNPSAGDQS